MKRFKRIMKLIGLICLIILASVGLGLAGGAPIPSLYKRNQIPDIKIELLEEKEEDSEVISIEIKE